MQASGLTILALEWPDELALVVAAFLAEGRLADHELAQQRPGVQEVRINYGSGYFCNLQPRKFCRTSARRRRIRLYQQDGALVLDLPSAGKRSFPSGRSRGYRPRTKHPDCG